MEKTLSPKKRKLQQNRKRREKRRVKKLSFIPPHATFSWNDHNMPPFTAPLLARPVNIGICVYDHVDRTVLLVRGVGYNVFLARILINLCLARYTVE